ncbi:MAG: spore germination protein [Oscillospiraceae bacterium]|nr:spore germination protein [Oscillospiraceae bacterium]
MFGNSAENRNTAPKPGDRVSSQAVEDTFRDCFDFVKRTIRVGGGGAEVTLCFLDSLVNGEAVASTVIRPLTDSLRFTGTAAAGEIAGKMVSGVTYTATVKRRDSLRDTVTDLLNGYCAVILDAEGAAVTFEVKSTDARAVEAPKEEKVIKGSKEAFTEVLKTNVTLVRRRLRDPMLKAKTVTVGDRSATAVAIVYIQGFTKPEMVAEAEKRLSAIRSDGVITAAAIEENIADQPISPFPQLIYTERADKFCLNLLEGRVGIIADGLPLGYLAPGTFSQFFKVPEDAANHFMIASVLTFLRYAAMVITLILPAFYVAVAIYHHEMLPAKLMESVIEAKKSVPFPTAAEVTLMLIAFELLQEAGLRLPNPVGDVVSIIGALVVGQAAVEARVVSPIVVIIIAVAGISGSAMPSQDMASALRISRFVLVILSIVGGLFGIVMGVVMLVWHLSTLETFGVPYMTPFAGGDRKKTSRALVRKPLNT